jgi:hypothetical protein
MTPAIPDGYEIATERREGLKRWQDGEWVTIIQPIDPQKPLWEDEFYIAPIRLRLGENYRCRNGQEKGPLVHNTQSANPLFKFAEGPVGYTWMDNGNFYYDGTESPIDIVAHIPKEEKKMEKTIQFKSPEDFKICLGSGLITLPISTIIALAQLPDVIAEVERTKPPKVRYQSQRNVSQYTMGERAIQSARTLIEGMDADPRLTEAGNKIEEALLLVMEYTDEQIEKKRQKEIKLGDKVFDHRFSRWWFVASIDDDGFCYAEEMKEGGRYCGKPDDLVKISDEEFATLEAIKSRVP